MENDIPLFLCFKRKLPCQKLEQAKVNQYYKVLLKYFKADVRARAKDWQMIIKSKTRRGQNLAKGAQAALSLVNLDFSIFRRTKSRSTIRFLCSFLEEGISNISSIKIASSIDRSPRAPSLKSKALVAI